MNYEKYYFSFKITKLISKMLKLLVVYAF